MRKRSSLNRPIRARALDFFQKLDGEVRSHPAYAELQGILHFNRGSPEEAIEPFSEVFEFDSSIDNLMRLVGSHIVCGSREAVDELLKRDGVDDLPGSPLARMNYSHVLLDFGEGERALEVGYRALIDGFEHDVVVMMFMGLILKPSDSRPTDHDDLVTQGTWTRLTSSGGEDYEALVGESESRPWGDKADPEKLVRGKGAGTSGRRRIRSYERHNRDESDVDGGGGQAGLVASLSSHYSEVWTAISGCSRVCEHARDGRRYRSSS